jgi:hypothetical protein
MCPPGKIITLMTTKAKAKQKIHLLKSPCNSGIQTADHLIFQCKRLRNETAILKSSVLQEGKWPASKCELTNRNLKQFINYINSMDFEKINQSNE